MQKLVPLMEVGGSGLSFHTAVGLAEKGLGRELENVTDRTQRMVAGTVREAERKEKHAQMQKLVQLMGDGISGVSSPVAVGLAEKGLGPELENVIGQPQRMVARTVWEEGHKQKHAQM